MTKADEAADNYCKKNGVEYYEEDNRRQGNRTDLQAAAALVVQSGLREVALQMPETFIKFHNGLDKLCQISQAPRNFKPYVEWIWGPTGVGKTRSIVEKYPDLWISGGSGKFFNGYENQEVALFDDFRGSFCEYNYFLKLLDRYPLIIDIKNSHRQFNSKRIYITSCYPPDKVYQTIEDIRQLTRRIDKITDANLNSWCIDKDGS